MDRYGVVLAGVFAAVLAVGAHYEVLGYWFTGPDTIPLIETSRIYDTPSAVALFTEPLMHGTNFVALTGLFYRPVASLSYAIDYAIWGLDPFGYHLTDLVVHALAAALVVALLAEQLRPIDRPMNTASDRSAEIASAGGQPVVLAVAALAGGLVACHPLTAEVVPTPARRHDVLATVFVLASLWALARGLRIRPPSWRRYRYLGGSLLAFALALGSKEVGAVLPGLAVVWTALFAYGRTGRAVEAIRETIRIGLAYAVVSLCYLGLRVSVLGGIGGYVGPFGGIKATALPTLVSQYLLSLFYPVDILGLGMPPSEYVPWIAYALFGIAVLSLAVGVRAVGGVGPFVRSRVGRLALFYSAWLCAPVPLLVRVGEYSPWTGYIAIVPVAALAAVTVGFAACDLHRRLDVSSMGDRGERLRAGANALAFVCVACLIVSLLVVSPLVQPYAGWDRAGTITQEALTGAEESTQGLPPDALIRVQGLPPAVTRASPTATPRAKSLRYFWAHSIRSWIRLRNPDSRISTFTYGQTRSMPNGSIRVRVRTTPHPDGPAVMDFQYTNSAHENATRSRELPTARYAPWHNG